MRDEIERQIETGQCAYCRSPAHPERPLTREHVIPRARGGRRKDPRIIVPACARCNNLRGSNDLIPFLLARPQRISSFLDFLTLLSPESVRQIDLRIFAELYTAVAILNDAVSHGPSWRVRIERLCAGRSLHRRRYAARRAVSIVSGRVHLLRDQLAEDQGPSCFIPSSDGSVIRLITDEPVDRMASRLLGFLAILWEVSAPFVDREIARAVSGTAVETGPMFVTTADIDDDMNGVLPLDGWRERPRRKRTRVDRRQGRGVRPVRGRAA